MTTLLKPNSFTCTAPCGCSVTRSLPSGVFAQAVWLPSCQIHNPAPLRTEERKALLFGSGEELYDARSAAYAEKQRRAEVFPAMLEALEFVRSYGSHGTIEFGPHEGKSVSYFVENAIAMAKGGAS